METLLSNASSEKEDLPRQKSHKWVILGIVLIGVFMSTLDSSIVNVALPTIITEFGRNISAAAWIVTAYVLTITSTLLLFGKMGDVFGRKKIYMIGFLVFTFGSLICSLSFSILQLTASRIIQALGASVMMTVGPAVVTLTFPSSERGRAFGMIGVAVAAGSTVGPVLGGFLVQALGWRSIFFVNIPIGLIGAILMIKYIPKEEVRQKDSGFDWRGTVLFSAATILLVFMLNEGSNLGWSSLSVIALAATSILLFILFIYIEKRASDPLLDISLFRIRLFTTSNISALVSFITMMSLFFVLPFYFQIVFSYSPKQIGLALLPLPLTIMLVSPLSGYLSDKIGSRILCTAGLTIVFSTLLSTITLDVSSKPIDITLRLVAFGIGSAMFQSPNNSAIMGSVPPNRSGIASGMIATMRNLGGSIGVAVSGAILTTMSAYYILQGQTASDSFMSALKYVFIILAAICFVGIVASALKDDYRGRRTIGRLRSQGGDN
jgi:EmrB/QacA subfamily drug resistance transporter